MPLLEVTPPRDTDLRSRIDPGTTGGERQVLRISGGTPRWMDSPNFFARDYLSGDSSENASTGMAELIADMQGPISAGVTGGNVQFEEGVYRLTSTVDLTRFVGRIAGAGGGNSPEYTANPGHGTVFVWDGPAGEPVFRVRDSRDVIFENFRIEGKDGAIPSYGIEFTNVSGDGAGTNAYLVVRDVHIGRYTWSHQGLNKGDVARGIGFTGDNTNNDQFRIERVTMDYPTEYGLYVPNSQSVGGSVRHLAVRNPGLAAIATGASIGIDHPEFYTCPLAVDMLGNNAVVVLTNLRSEGGDMLARTSPSGVLSIRGGLAQVNSTIAGGQVFIDASPMDQFTLSLEDLMLTGNTTPAQARIEIGPTSSPAYIGRFFVSVRRCLNMHPDQLAFASGASMWAASPMSKGVVEWQSQNANSIYQFRNELRHSTGGAGTRTTLDKTAWDAPKTD